MANAEPYVPPTFRAGAFHCPLCKAYSAQSWYNVDNPLATGNPFESDARRCRLSYCSHCKDCCLWWDGVLVYPEDSPAPPPHPDMPTEIRADYYEASSVLQKSPRSAAALLRLCVQKLCRELGEPGENINTDIANMVKKGLASEVQKALDIVRVVGNEQVHPGQLDVRDDPNIAVELFNLVNFIVDDRISRPKAIQALYERLPTSKLDGIKLRDS